jgi:hypothetical protein
MMKLIQKPIGIKVIKYDYEMEIPESRWINIPKSNNLIILQFGIWKVREKGGNRNNKIEDKHTTNTVENGSIGVGFGRYVTENTRPCRSNDSRHCPQTYNTSFFTTLLCNYSPYYSYNKKFTVILWVREMLTSAFSFYDWHGYSQYYKPDIFVMQ